MLYATQIALCRNLLYAVSDIREFVVGYPFDRDDIVGTPTAGILV